MNSGQWSLFQVKGPDVLSITGERLAAVDGHILVPKLYGVLRQKILDSDRN